MQIFVIVEAENFSNGWCILPVLVEKEARLREAFENGYRDYPDMAQYSSGRYRYSGTKLTLLYPVSEVDFPSAGDYALWTRSKLYAGQDKGTYIVEIDSWQSVEFGGCAESESDLWRWQRDEIRIDEPGTKTITLRDTKPEACCDVLVLTTELDYKPEGNNPLQPHITEQNHKIISVPYRKSKKAIEKDTRVFEIHHGRPTAYNGYFGDLDGDGKDEIIIAFEDEYLEAFKYDGTSLWRCEVSFPWQKVNSENYKEKGYNIFIPHDFRPNPNIGYHIIDCCHVTDIDRDGEKEFVFGWNPMYIIDARTGRIKYERMLPGQGARMDIADLTGDGYKSEIIVVTKDAIDGKAFVHALDSKLETIWQTRVDGADVEHFIAVGDIDVDGKDEVAFTASNNLYCIDDDGKLMWEIRGRENWGGFDYHTDKLIIDDIDGDTGNGNELVLCEGTLFNKDGTIRWRVEGDFDHGQTIAVAKLREDYAGKQVIFGERNIGNIYCYSADGKPIWKRGRFHGERVHASDMILMNWSGHGKKEILCRYLGVFDEYGNLIKLPPYVDSGSADLRVADMVGDERDEIIVTIGTTTYIIMNTSNAS